MAQHSQPTTQDLTALLGGDGLLNADIPAVDIPAIPEELTTHILNAIAAGGDIDALSAELKAGIILIVMENGWAPEDGARAAEAFIESMLGSIRTGSTFQPTVDSAAQAYRDALMGFGEPPPQIVTPANELVARMADGEAVAPAVTDLIEAAISSVEAELLDGEQLQVATDTFIEHFQSALSEGKLPEDAMQLSMDALETRVIEQTVMAVELPQSDQLLAALSAGGDQAGDAIQSVARQAGLNGDMESFVSGVQDALAAGLDPDSAIAGAREASAAAARSQAAATVDLSPADRLLNALSTGGSDARQFLAANPEANSAAFASALESSLAGGTGIADAMDDARAAEQALSDQTAGQNVAISPADALAAALAGGAGLGGQLDGAAGDAFIETLASGNSAADALAGAQQAGQAAVALQQAQSVTVSPADALAAALAGGTLTDAALAGDGAFAEELMASLAAGDSADQALANATSAQQQHTQTVARQTVPVTDPQVLTMAGGDTAGPAVSPTTASAGGETTEPIVIARTESATPPEPAAAPDPAQPPEESPENFDTALGADPAPNPTHEPAPPLAAEPPPPPAPEPVQLAQAPPPAAPTPRPAPLPTFPTAPSTVPSDQPKVSAKPAVRDNTPDPVDDEPAVADEPTPNRAPVLTAGSNRSYTENANPLALAPGVSLSDLDGNHIVSASIRIVSGYQQGADQLSADTAATGLSASFDSDAGILSITGTAPAASYQQVLRSVSFANASETPSTSTRKLDITVSDGQLTDTQSWQVAVTSVNDVTAISFPLMGNIDEDSSAIVSGIRVTDLDGERLTVEVKVTAGSIVLTTPDSVTVHDNDGSDGLIRFSGTPDAITLALANSLRCEPAAGYVGPETLTMRIYDAPGGLVAEKSAAVQVVNTPDTPEGESGSVDGIEDMALVIDADDFGFSDVDAGDSMKAVRIDSLPASGTLALNANAVSAGDIITLADIDAGRLGYTGALHDNGTAVASFNFSVQDQTDRFDIHSRTLSIDLQAVNDAPTLSQFAAAVDSVDEDNQAEVTLAELNAQADEADVDDGVSGYRVKAVSSGSLQIGTSAAEASAYAAGSNDLVDADHHAYWTPDDNANGTLNAFTVEAVDHSGAESGTPVQVVLDVNAVNDAPTLTTFNSTIASGNEDNEIQLSFNALNQRGDEADVDGPVTGYRVEAVLSGSLKIGADGASATAYAIGSNDQINSGKSAFWTPDAHAHGSLDAFSVKALDGAGAASADAVTATVEINEINDAPSLSGFSAAIGAVDEDNTITIGRDALLQQGNANDVDGEVTAFVVQAVSSGSLKIGETLAGATAFAAGSNAVIDADNNAYWTPATNANGLLNAFTVKARDNDLALSSSAVQATVNVNDVNDAPTLTTFGSAIADTAVNTPVEISRADLIGAGDEQDVDGSVTGFIVQSVSSGSLKIGADAASASDYAAGSNDLINAGLKAFWTPALNARGSLDAFTVKAQDDDGALSASAVQTRVAVNELPTLSQFSGSIGSGDEDSQIELTFNALNSKGNEQDSDGTVDAYVVQAVSSGSLKIGTSVAAATAFAAGSNDVIDATHKAYWTPAADANGTLDAFTVKARDDDGELSTSAVQTQVSVDAKADDPVVTAGGGATVYAVGGGPRQVDASITIGDVDGSFSNSLFRAQVTANASGNDRLSIADTGGITLVGTSVRYNGTEIGVLDGSHQGVGTDSLEVTLNANATDSSVTALGRALAYRNTSTAPDMSARTVTTTIEEGGHILFVSDSGTGGAIADVLENEGYTVTRVMDNFNGSTTPALHGDLSAYSAVFWSAAGSSSGTAHSDSSLFSNLVNYVSNGGRVFVTGYDAIISPSDPNLVGFLGGTSSSDSNTNHTISSTANSLTTGVVDIRGVTPSGAYGDLDQLILGAGASATGVAYSGTNATWALRSLGSGEIAWVSNGISGTSGSHASWSNTSAGGAGVYNAAIRNFAASASGGSGGGRSDSATQSISFDHAPVVTHVTTVADFDGNNSFVELPSISALAGAFTFEAWISLTEFNSNWARIIDIGQGPDNDEALLAFHGETNSLTFWTRNGNVSSELTYNPWLENGHWYHVAAVNDGAGSATLYLNGVAVATSGNQQVLQGVDRQVGFLGRSNFESENGDRRLDARLSDVRIWNDARTADEIADNMNRDIAGQDNLLAWYKLDETAGETAADSSGNGLHATFNEVGHVARHAGFEGESIAVSGIWISDLDDAGQTVTVTYALAGSTISLNTGVAGGISAAEVSNNGSASVTVTSTIQKINSTFAADDGLTVTPPAGGTGRFDLGVTVTANGNDSTGSVSVEARPLSMEMGGALQLDGVNDWLDLGNDSSLDFSNKSFSWSFWAQHASSGTDGFILGQGNDADHHGLHIGFRDNGDFTFAFYGNDLNYTGSTDAGWHHWAGSYDAASKQRIIYRDGIAVASDTAGADYQGSGSLSLGQYNGAYPFLGLIDELSLWNGRVLTADDVQRIRHEPLSGNEKGLAAYYRFDGDGPAQVVDNTVHAGSSRNDAELNNGAHIINTLGRAVELSGAADDYISVATPAELISNGSFEAPGIDAALPTGWQSISNDYGAWGGTTELASGGSFVLHPGHNFGAGGVYQDISTVIGKTYTLSFFGTGFTSGNASQDGLVKVGTPGADANSLALNNNAELVDATFSAPLHADAGDWSAFSYRFTATATTTRVSFQNVDKGAGNNAINVDLVSVSELDDFDISAGSPFTIEAWIRLDTIAGERIIIDKAAGIGADATQYRLYVSNGKLGFFSGNGYESSNAVINAKQWHHVAVSYDGTGLSAFVDGQKQSGGIPSLTVNAANTGALLIGKDPMNIGRNVDGEIGELRFWNLARSDSQIAADYNQTLDGSETGLVGYWHFGDKPGSGDSTADSSGESHTATLQGNAVGVDTAHVFAAETLEVQRNGSISGMVDSNDTAAKTYARGSAPNAGTLSLDSASGHWVYTPDEGYSGNDSFSIVTSGGGGASVTRQYQVDVETPTSPGPADGRTGNNRAATFDGSGDYLSAGHQADFDLGFFTIEAWVKPTAIDSFSVIWSNMDLGTDTGYWLNIESDGQLRHIIGDADGDDSNDMHLYSGAGHTLSAGEWNHVAVSYDGENVRLFMNGSQVATDTYTRGVGYANTAFTLGVTSIASQQPGGNSTYFTGEMDNVRIWETARNADHIARDYDKVLSGSEDGLLALYQMDGNSGGTVQDNSGNGHDLSAGGNTGRSNLKDITISAGSVYKGLILGSDGSDGHALSYSENTDAANAASVNADGTFVFDAGALAANDYSFSVDISDGIETYTDTVEITVV